MSGRHAFGAPDQAAPRADPAEPTAAPEPAKPASPPRPSTAAEALDRATAAYEFGDLHQMIDLARLVAEGALPGNEEQRTTALRLLGIGLYLDGRLEGAEKAFVDLIKLRPRATLDPSVTRPEVVGFFRDVRRRHEPKKHLVLAFLPPFGQFQNATPVRGWIIGGLEVATLGAAISSTVLLHGWRNQNAECTASSYDVCARMKVVNKVAVAGLAATWAFGVVDALLNYKTDDPEARASANRRSYSLSILPTGAALRVSF